MASETVATFCMVCEADTVVHIIPPAEEIYRPVEPGGYLRLVSPAADAEVDFVEGCDCHHEGVVDGVDILDALS